VRKASGMSGMVVSRRVVPDKTASGEAVHYKNKDNVADDGEDRLQVGRSRVEEGGTAHRYSSYTALG
jgi:hypothetical protein